MFTRNANHFHGMGAFRVGGMALPPALSARDHAVLHSYFGKATKRRSLTQLLAGLATRLRPATLPKR
jgi:hypothetical protein